MGDFFSFTHDGGDILTAEEAGLPTKDGGSGEHAARINESQKYNFQMRQGADAAEAQQITDAQAKIDTFNAELDRLEVLRASGEPINDATRRHVRGTMADVAIAYVDRAGGSLDDPDLIELRARVNGQNYLTHLADNIPDPPVVSF